MSEKVIQISAFDRDRLRKLIDDAYFTDRRGSAYLARLQQELERAEIVAPQEVAHTLITMNSTVVLCDEETGEEETYTLVFPEEADIAQGKISVLAPIGTAMLGYAVGDVFTWAVPAGTRRLRVKEILYQPEAAGDFHL